jgi:putative lipoprotein
MIKLELFLPWYFFKLALRKYNLMLAVVKFCKIMFIGEAMKKLIIFMIALLFCGCGIASKGDGSSTSENLHIARKVAIDIAGGRIKFDQTAHEKFWRNLNASKMHLPSKFNPYINADRDALEWIKVDAYAMINLNIEFLKSALATSKNGTVTKTDKFKSYEKNIEKLAPSVATYATEQQYKSKMMIKEIIAKYADELSDCVGVDKFTLSQYAMRIVKISDNGRLVYFDFEGVKFRDLSRDGVNAILNGLEYRKDSLDNLFDKNYRW